MTNNDKYYDDTKWAPLVEKNKNMLLDTAVDGKDLMMNGAAHEMFIYLTGLEERGRFFQNCGQNGNIN